MPGFDGALLKSKGVTTSLGEKDFDGVRANILHVGDALAEPIRANALVARMDGDDISRPERLDLQLAAMHHDGVNAEQLQQHHIGRELTRHGALAHGVAAVFDDHGLAVIDLNIRQGLGERLRRLPAAFFRLAFCFVHHAREIAGDGGGVTREA